MAWHPRKREIDAIDQHILHHYVDMILDAVEDSVSPELYVIAIQIMNYLVQTELEHYGDKFGGN